MLGEVIYSYILDRSSMILSVYANQRLQELQYSRVLLRFTTVVRFLQFYIIACRLQSVLTRLYTCRITATFHQVHDKTSRYPKEERWGCKSWLWICNIDQAHQVKSIVSPFIESTPWLLYWSQGLLCIVLCRPTDLQLTCNQPKTPWSDVSKNTRTQGSHEQTASRVYPLDHWLHNAALRPADLRKKKILNTNCFPFISYFIQ